MLRLAFAFVTFFVFGTACVRADVPVPALTARVTDEAGTLTSDQKATLEQTLKEFESRKGTQISVLIVPTTEPESIEQFSMRVVEQWKLGRKNVDDGALLIVAMNDRALRIEVGYGLEGALTDATSNRIINETILPRFKAGDFYGGISAGLDSIMRVASGEPLPPPSKRHHASEGGAGRLLPVLFLLTVMAGGLLRAVFGRLPGAFLTGGVVGLLAWVLSSALFVAVAAGMMALLFTLLGGGMGPGGGRFIGGRGGRFGGDSHQDIFRGGGGGFGGGGASGRW
ncbi:TPM domain-containing protein [Burkholderia pseudomultivorans]|uniref:TPM domain-containing protein n=1 Tax=Burkholderia pseudomultivorans TaxID=1207504 RepID=UPI00188E1065|nr:YgcG family protein [Burkholderia pseudomultivorans]MBF5008708.1 YgcG family protein [Burkholderia pseudomultivorans]